MTTKALPNNKILMTFKIDKDLKKEITIFSEEIGIPVSTLINSLVKRVVKAKRFEVDLKKTSFSTLEELDSLLEEGLKGRRVQFESSYFKKMLTKAKNKK